MSLPGLCSINNSNKSILRDNSFFINLVKNFIAAQSGKSDDASPPWLMLANSAIRTSKARKLRPTCWTANLPDSRAAGQPGSQLGSQRGQQVTKVFANCGSLKVIVVLGIR